MSSKRVSALVLAIAAILVAAATVSLTGAKATRPSDDFAVRHPEGMLRGAAFYAGQDFAQRHPELSEAVSLPVTSDDFGIRHREGMFGAGVVPAWYYTGDDYALRRPQLSAASAIDTSDYFLRHPKLIVSQSDDYALRHPELSSQ
jgi:hypothetical protein